MKIASDAIYSRVLLKLSGEALLGNNRSIDFDVLSCLAAELKKIQDLGVQVAIVVGGGNILRGKDVDHSLFSRVTADHMAMLATVMNGLALEEAFFGAGLKVAHFSAFPISKIVKEYYHRDAIEALSSGKIVIFSGGTGNPCVTTDTAASLRAIEIGADIILKATKVDGIYSEDPIKNPSATFFEKLSYQDVISRSLAVMDLSAICLCKDHLMPIRVFNMHEPNVIMNLMLGSEKGTLVS
jgi:uridylate kinase